MAVKLLIPYCKSRLYTGSSAAASLRCNLGMLGDAEIPIVSESRIVSMKMLCFIGLMALGGVGLYGQPTNRNRHIGPPIRLWIAVPRE